MTICLLLTADVPMLPPIFPPMTLVEQVQHTPFLVFGVMMCCLAAAFLALWRAARDYRVFRTLGWYYLLVGTEQFLRYFGADIPYWSMRAIASGLLVGAAGEAMQVPRRRWIWLFWPICLFVSVAVWFPSMTFTRDWPVMASEIPLAILTILSFRRGTARDKTIAAAFLFYLVVRLTLFTSFQSLTGIRTYATIGGLQWPYTTCALTALGAVTLTILVRDLIRDRAEKQRLAAELAASRAVQQVLIPDQIPSIAGFTVQSVYRPFGDVGGDFFQILPLDAGGAMVVIGDVSGKGMPAAMTVSLAMGALSLAVETTTKPGEILAALNRALCGRNRDGFTTCLVIRVDADGSLTIANAGHLAPYIDGQELQLDNGLPLGLAVDSKYPETSFHLPTDHHILLLTDGVVEARSKTGKLFGFDDTAAISSQSAESIAQAAQTFGQEDDITVLTVMRAAAGA
jgi:hypothetical protein